VSGFFPDNDFSNLPSSPVAFAEIDWHDYAIVQTIEFTAADANAELPPPMSVQEVENMTLAQKRMAAMVMETTVDDVEALRARQAAAEAEAAAAVGTVGIKSGDDEGAMEQSDDESDADDRKRREEQDRLREIERAQALQASSMNVNAAGPIKIRTDYVPKRKFPRILFIIFTDKSHSWGQEQDRNDDLLNLWAADCR
jgi:splicing factor 3A subunit 1